MIRNLFHAAVTAGAIAIATIAFAQDEALVEAGEAVYAEHCATCHGEKLRDPGAAPDLRELRATDRPRFETTVMDGKGQMPSWAGTVSQEQVAQLWAYIRAHAFAK